MNDIEIFLPIEPPSATQQEKQVNWKTKTLYQGDRSKDAKEKLRAYLVKHIPDQMVAPPIEMTVIYGFGLKAKHQTGEWKSTKPDLDNLQKALQDAMTELGFYKDDSHIAKLSVMKFWTYHPGISITLRHMEGDVYGRDEKLYEKLF